MRTRHALRIALAGWALAAVSLWAQPAVDTKAVDALMERTLREWKIPGAALAIVRDDKVVYVRGYGTKEAGGTASVGPDTLFQLASTSKAFTSTSLAMLATDHKLSFDDRVRDHLEYFRLADECADANVTIRDIVSHRTGLSRHDELWDNTPVSREEVVREIGRVALSKPFRTEYQYQNIMFIAAGEVVTHAAGMTWDEFVKTRIFTPLHMTRTITSDAAWNADEDHATGHSYHWKTGTVQAQRPIDTNTIGAAGAIKSSARDMANWLRFQLADGAFEGRQLVAAEQLAETKTPQTVIRMSSSTKERNPETNVMSYAMAWNVQDYRGQLLVSHAGALNGFRAHVDLLPKQKAGFVVLINSGRGVALVAVRNALADMLLGAPARDWNALYLASDRKEDEETARKREERLARNVRNTKPTLPLEAYTGEYHDDAYGTATIALVDGRLLLQWNRLAIPLQHEHYDQFNAYSESDDVDEDLVFGLAPDHTVTSLSLFGQTFRKKADR
jgi:CubicO group peptidase (beta-lactamase class C family)